MGKANRQPVSKKDRFEAFKRDGFACQYCGRTPPAVTLEVDHMLPVSAGGGSSVDNLLTSCFDCNRGKASALLTSVPDSVTGKMEVVSERREQLEAYNKLLLKLRFDEDNAVNDLGWAWLKAENPRRRKPMTLGGEYAQSMRMFVRKLSPVEIKDAIQIAFHRKHPAKCGSARVTWKYFCGICWSMIREKGVDYGR